MDPHILKIVLTGGPCGGKTACKEWLHDKFGEIGYKVITVPELATILSNNNAGFPQYPHCPHSFERVYVGLQSDMETAFERLAKLAPEPTVVICDRGMMEAKAFVTEEAWLDLQVFAGKTEAQMILAYDVVLHLTTAAKGAEAFYTRENNPARTENLEQARELDDLLLEAWEPHPNRFVIENDPEFQKKLDSVWKVISSQLPCEIQND